MKLLAHLLFLASAALALFSGCTSGSGSTSSAPVGCASDAECTSGKHCDPKQGCVACLFDTQCPADQRCDSGMCYPRVACTASTDCAGSDFPVCNGNTGECVRCLADSDCGDSARCQAQHCQKIAKCASEADCAAGSHCDLGLGQCVACVTRADCAANQDCSAGICQTRCSSEADCAASGTHCSSAGHCSECVSDAQCPDVYHCAAGSCVQDECAQGVTDCAPKGGLRTCSANGDRSTITACAASQSCGVTSGVASCQPWLCSPKIDSCDDSGTQVQHCAADGLSFTGSDDCPHGQSCVGGACVKIACTPNHLLCKSGNSFLCSGDGTTSALQTTCSDVQHCDAESGACVDNACSAGQVTCVGESVATCRSDASGYDLTACALNQICRGGECADLVCAPNTQFCGAGGTVQQCNADGTQQSVLTTCAQSQHCVASSETYAYCSTNSCTPGTPLCNSSLATVCSKDGSGPEPGGTDCAKAGGFCSGGICKPPVCSPAKRFCQYNDVYTCSSDGSYASLYQTCYSYYSPSSVCNPDTAVCDTKVCTPNAVTCLNDTVVQCNATGFSTNVVEDCTLSGKKCLSGQCVPTVCDPSIPNYCKNGNVYHCNPGGTGEYVSSLCPAQTFCSNGYCQQDVCQAGKPVCNGNAVSTCASDGSGPTGAGTACATNQTCVNGACVATTCTPNAFSCSGGNVQHCNAQGTGSTLYQYCVSETYCDSGLCKPDVCPNGANYCSQEAFATCKADGSGPATTPTNCAAASKVCTISGCSASALDSLGSSENVAYESNSFDGDIILVQTPRKLTKLEVYVSQSSSATLNFAVYSSTDGRNFYQLSSTSAPTPATLPGWASSAPLSVELQANTYYLFGLAKSYGTYLSYGTEAPTSTSFGLVRGGVYYTGLTLSSFAPIDAGYVFDERLTTALP